MTEQDNTQLSYVEAFKAGIAPPLSGAETPEASGESQGEEGTDQTEPQGFVDKYLSQVPEDYHPHIRPYLEDVERNTNSKFQEHADYRKQWAPYETLGVNEVDPEVLEQLMEFGEIASDEDSLKEWIYNAANELGLIEDSDDDDDDEDWDEDDPDEVIDQSTIQQAIAEELDSKLAPILEQMREQEQQEEVERASDHIDTTIAQLKDQFGDFDEQIVYRFALAYDGPDAIERGFLDYQDAVKEIEGGVFSDRSNQPLPPEGEGLPNSQGEAVTDFKESKALAKDRLAQSRGM
jgi:hypothetical protein